MISGDESDKMLRLKFCRQRVIVTVVAVMQVQTGRYSIVLNVACWLKSAAAEII